MSYNTDEPRPALPASPQSQTSDLIVTLWALHQRRALWKERERERDEACPQYPGDLLQALRGWEVRRLWGEGRKMTLEEADTPSNLFFPWLPRHHSLSEPTTSLPHGSFSSSFPWVSVFPSVCHWTTLCPPWMFHLHPRLHLPSTHWWPSGHFFHLDILQITYI